MVRLQDGRQIVSKINEDDTVFPKNWSKTVRPGKSLDSENLETSQLRHVAPSGSFTEASFVLDPNSVT